MITAILKKPSAWVPIILSVIALVTMVSYISTHTVVRQADEGTGAHLFQIWLVVEAVLILFFALKWLPKRPKQAFFVLVLQIIFMLAAMFPVYYYKL